jgi:hypothetical protein
MKKIVFAAYGMGAPPGPGGRPDPQRGVIECPVGFEPVEAMVDNQGRVIITGWQGEGNPVLVPHPLLIITAGMTANLMIGEVIGQKIGTVILPQGFAVTVFVRGPWPTSTIEAIATVGKA